MNAFDQLPDLGRNCAVGQIRLKAGGEGPNLLPVGIHDLGLKGDDAMRIQFGEFGPRAIALVTPLDDRVANFRDHPASVRNRIDQARYRGVVDGDLSLLSSTSPSRAALLLLPLNVIFAHHQRDGLGGE